MTIEVITKEPSNEDLLNIKKMRLRELRRALATAGIEHIDIVYDEECEEIRYYKRALALCGKLEDSVIKTAHVLGWHKFE